MDNKNIVRFLLTFFLVFIGSIIIYHSSLKPEGFTSRSWAYFILAYVTFGIYPPSATGSSIPQRIRTSATRRLNYIPRKKHTEAKACYLFGI